MEIGRNSSLARNLPRLSDQTTPVRRAERTATESRRGRKKFASTERHSVYPSHEQPANFGEVPPKVWRADRARPHCYPHRRETLSISSAVVLEDVATSKLCRRVRTLCVSPINSNPLSAIAAIPCFFFFFWRSLKAWSTSRGGHCSIRHPEEMPLRTGLLDTV